MRTWSAGRNNPLDKISSDSGFTLLELLVVIGIMGLIYGLAVPLFSRLLPSVTLNSTAEEVVADLRQSRLKSILSGKPVTFVLQKNGEGYSLPDLKIDKRTKGIALSFQEKEKQKVIFTPDGKNSGFKLVLTTGTGESQREKKITSDWITGRIAMVETGP